MIFFSKDTQVCKGLIIIIEWYVRYEIVKPEEKVFESYGIIIRQLDDSLS